ncbi:MAG: S41 family peptidase [Armatimonadota bacterium]
MRKNNSLSFKLSMVLVILLIFQFVAYFAYNEVHAQARSINSNDILYTVKLLKSDYIKDINVNQFLNEAIRGGNKYLKEILKLKDDEIPLLNEQNDTRENMNIFSERINSVLDKYKESVDKSKFIYACISSMLEILSKPPYDDPYTLLMTPGEFKILKEQMSGGNFGGVGIYIQTDKKNNNQLTVIEPIENTPAYKAGLKSGDIILKINDEPTKGMDIEVAAQKIRGKMGSSVVLTVDRKGVIKKYVIIREKIHVKSAQAKLINKKIGYIKLRYFGENTDYEFNKALEVIKEKGAQALILDLRNNGGGYITAAKDVCSKFLPRGSLVVSVINERTNLRENYYSDGRNGVNIPVVILINEYSASASEITAGALQDTKKAMLIGEQSFGKASVQQIHEFRDNSAIKYTVAHYFTPDGKDINSVGIKPNISVKMDPTNLGKDDDAQLIEAVYYLIDNYNLG